MKAAVFEDIKKIVYREDYPKPEIEADYIIVRVNHCAICGSDITNFKFKMFKTGIIMGHEFAGTVAEIGENIDNFKIGEKVVGINVLPGGSYGEIRGMGVFINGGFAEYVKVYKDDLFHAPVDNPTVECSLVESFAVVVRAIKLSKIQEGEKIAIIGSGNIGLTNLIVLLGEKNPDYVLIIEPHEFLREKAKSLGATDALPSSKGKLRKFFKENGKPTYIFECAGNENALKLAIDIIDRGGKIMIEGIHKGNMTFPIFLINNKELTIQGAISHDSQDILDAIELFNTKKVDPGVLISEIIPLKDIQNGFERFLEPGERKFIKIIVEI